MTKQTYNFYFSTILVLTFGLTACSNSDNRTSAITTDTLNVPPPPKDTVSNISQDSTTSFVSQTKEVANKKGNKLFNDLDYNKVIAYDYEGVKGSLDIITNGKLAPSVKKQKELTQDQVDALTNYLGDPATYGSGVADCFDPHLGIVFYKDNKVVAHISICLECNYLHSSIPIPAIDPNKSEGFTKSGIQKINSLCRQLNFTHCID